MPHFIEDIRETTWRVLALTMLAVLGASLLVNFVAVQPAVREVLSEIERTTVGLVQVPLVAAPLYFAIVGTIVFGVGRLRWSDVGWRRSAIAPGLLVTFAFWIAMQCGLAVWVMLFGEQLAFNRAWTTLGIAWFTGQLLGQLLGNALLEEMVFRGFFLPQFYLKASARLRPIAALALALFASQVPFAMTHIPHRLLILDWPAERLLPDQLQLTAQALTYCAVYLITRNIFICVGLHALWNQPARLLTVPFVPDVQIVWYSLVLILLVVWPVARRFRIARQMPVKEGDRPSLTRRA
jgi:membrane protease YdiL (CAAX protease family)